MAYIIKIKNDSGSTKTWCGKEFTDQEEYIVPTDNNRSKWINNSELLTAIGNAEALVGDGSGYISDINTAINWLKNGLATEVSLSGVTPNLSRLPVTNNRIPAGYSIYGVGEADNITNGTYGGGVQLQFDSTNDEREFQLLNHYYAIGARAVWKNCDIDNYFSATLIAPASSGFTNTTGDFDKVNLGGSLNMYKPVTAGTGAWDADLTDTLAGTSILKATPVPSAGNQGWFDYDSETNILTTNMSQTGGYNLYDFDVNLHAFGRRVWGTSQSGGVTGIDVPDLVGKLIYNSWKVKLEFGLEGGLLGSEKAAVTFYVGTKGNI